MHSCVYEGVVIHRRFAPVRHTFRYRIAMVMLDVDEVDPPDGGQGPLAWLSRRRFSVASFCSDDHFGPTEVDADGRPVEQSSNRVDDFGTRPSASAITSPTKAPVDRQATCRAGGSFRRAIETRIERVTGNRPAGPIRMLTQLRYGGFYFSPLNLFYVFDPDGRRVESVLAEVSNTPWGEKHCYVLWAGNRRSAEARPPGESRPSAEAPGIAVGGSNNDVEDFGSTAADSPLGKAAKSAKEVLRYEHAKTFHVSPFMPLEMTYRWTIDRPADSLRVALSNHREGDRVHVAAMALRRRRLTRWGLRRVAIRYPWMTGRIMLAIYWQALRLWLRGVPTFMHPKRSPAASAADGSLDRSPTSHES